MLKVFGIETGDKEESRAEMADIDTISQSQIEHLISIMVDGNSYTEKGARVAKAFKIANFGDIKSKKFDQILKALA